MLYPIDRLPLCGLTQEELVLLQCGYIWLQTYSTTEAMPQCTSASYSELWFILSYMQQIMSVMKSLPMSFDHFKQAHEARYNEAILFYTNNNSHDVTILTGLPANRVPRYIEVLHSKYEIIKGKVCTGADGLSASMRHLRVAETMS